MEFRDFEIEEHDENTIVIRQSDFNGGYDSLFLDKEQTQFFIDKLQNVLTPGIKDSFEYTAIVTVEQDNIEASVCISSSSIKGLFEEKQNLFDCFIEDAEHVPFQTNSTTISNISKVKVIERDL